MSLDTMTNIAVDMGHDEALVMSTAPPTSPTSPTSTTSSSTTSSPPSTPSPVVVVGKISQPLSAQQVLELLPSDCCDSGASGDGQLDQSKEPDARPKRQLSASKATTMVAALDNEAFRHHGGKRQHLLDATILLQEVLRDKDILEVELSAEERTAFIGATGRVFFNHPENHRRSRSLATKRTADRLVLKNTGIRRLRNQPRYVTPAPRTPQRSSSSLQPSTTSTRLQITGIVTARGVNREEEEGREEEQEGIPAGATTECKRKCYVCKAKYSSVHHFYDRLCPDNDKCAPLNFRKRGELADLSGKVALLTGGRIKIGYQAAIKLLRCGCARVIVTTRFPRDAAARYAAEPDFKEWGGRLEIFGLDLRHTPSVEAFCHFVLDRYDRLDFIVNNAAQTVRRPPRFYEHMMAGETAPLATLGPEVRQLLSAYEGLLSSLGHADNSPASMAELPPPPHHGASDHSVINPPPSGSAPPTTPSSPLSSTVLSPPPSSSVRCNVGLARPAELSQIPLAKEDFLQTGPSASVVFPTGQLDQDLQQVDLRDTNSWRLELPQVSTVELLETQLVNAVAPFIINARLKPLMEATPGAHKHIVNVSAMEGQFYRQNKTTRHPHTNMAKAALNMMTRTSAPEYEASGIHMNSVDTGWVTNENPVAGTTTPSTAVTTCSGTGRVTSASIDSAGGDDDAGDDDRSFQPPLDIVDGAARILDPIIDGMNTGTHVWGRFLKDYEPTDW